MEVLGMNLPCFSLEVRCQRNIPSPRQNILRKRKEAKKKKECRVQGLEQGIKGLFPPLDKNKTHHGKDLILSKSEAGCQKTPPSLG
jgi:hypothetical protein